MLDANCVEKEEYEVNIYANIERNLRSYSGFVSLLRELIQNSDDSCTDGKDVEIEIYFFKDKLVLKNNTSFNENDWKKIKEIGSRNKEGTSNKTGRFGIGFTSVFKICDKAKIHSKNVSRVVDLNEKSAQKWGKYPSPKYTFEDITEFEFFWRFEDSFARTEIGADIITLEKIDDFIDEVLTNIQYDLHFLSHITKLDIYKNDKLIHKIRIEKKSSKLFTTIYKDIKTITVDETKKRKIIYHKNLENHFVNEFENKIARRRPFLLSIAVEDFINQKGRVFCTLPTELTTGFSFDINCDFQPDQNRKQLILDEDDSKGEYNLKIFSFLPEFLYEILDDLKEETSAESLYEILSSSEPDDKFNHLYNEFLKEETSSESLYKILSEPSDKFNHLYNEFINLIKQNDSELIYIDNKWHSISESKLLGDSIDKQILSFLRRANYPIISPKYCKFSQFFKKLGVTVFSLDNLINLVQNNIPKKIRFNESPFESKSEYFNLFSFISRNIDAADTNRLTLLNIILTESGYLTNNSDGKIFSFPVELSSIKDDFPLYQINSELWRDFKNVLFKLRVRKFKRNDLLSIISLDYPHFQGPIDLVKARPYLNSKEKLLIIISFIEPFFKDYDGYLKAENLGKFEYNGNLLEMDDPHVLQIKENVQRIRDLPILLSDDGRLFSLNDSKLFLLKSKSNFQREFVDLIGLDKLESEYSEKVKNFRFVPSLNLNKMVALFKSFINANGSSENEIILFYQLISENKHQLNVQTITLIKEMSIFKNTNGDFCALNDGQREMLLQGSYTVPKGIKIYDIIDDENINNIPGVRNFRKDVLESYFKIETLDFNRFILYYFPAIFNENKVANEDKFDLVTKLNDEFLKIEREINYGAIEDVLLTCNLVFCDDNQFHCPSKETIFFRSEEFDQLFGKNYHYPKFKDEDISRYSHLFEQLGVNKDLDAEHIIEYISKSITEAINSELLMRMTIIFEYINTSWDAFDENDCDKFRELANKEWLPASVSSSNLYLPSDLYLENTRPFLSEFDEILYFKGKNPRNDFAKIIGLNNIQKVSTETIIENLKRLSNNKKLIPKSLSIYSELDKRAKNNPNSVQALKNFGSIHIKYNDEEHPRYFSTSEVFKRDYTDSYGFEYIGYLPSSFLKFEHLLQSTEILDEPDVNSIVDILRKIENKYQGQNYNISVDNDKIIVYKCLEFLSKNVGNSDFSENIIFTLQNMHILCNANGQLITPKYAILDDNKRISNQFRELLDNRLIKNDSAYFSLLNKLDIKKMSQSVTKELLISPSSNSLRLNDKYTRKLEAFSKLIPRIKIANQDLHMDINELKEIHSESKVYDFDDLQVSKYVLVDGDEYVFEEDNASCFINISQNKIADIYVRGSDYEVLSSFSTELFESLHPNLNINLKGTIKSLLEYDSYEAMNHYLTDFGYPEINEVQNKSLDVNKQIEDEGEWSSSTGDDDFFVENEDYISDDSELPTSSNCKEDFSSSDSGFEEKEDVDSRYSGSLDENNDDKLPTSSNCKEDFSLHDSGFEEKEDVDSKYSESLDENKLTNSGENDLGNRTHIKSKKQHQMSSSSSAKIKGRTKTPNEDMDFREGIEKQYSSTKRGTSISFGAIDDDLEPMSLEDEQAFAKTINSEVDKEITKIRIDNSKREYESRLEKLQDSHISKSEVKEFYNGGECQICGYTFTTKKGNKYCKTPHLIEKRNGGVRHPANHLCLCPNHSALLKHGTIQFKNLDDLNDDKLIFTDGERDYVINYHPIHFIMLKTLLNRRKTNHL